MKITLRNAVFATAVIGALTLGACKTHEAMEHSMDSAPASDSSMPMNDSDKMDSSDTMKDSDKTDDSDKMDDGTMSSDDSNK